MEAPELIVTELTVVAEETIGYSLSPDGITGDLSDAGTISSLQFAAVFQSLSVDPSQVFWCSYAPRSSA